MHWRTTEGQPADIETKFGELYAFTSFKGSNPSKKPREWFFAPAKWKKDGSYYLTSHRVICVQQIIPLVTTTSTLSTTTRGQVCNQVSLNSKYFCITYVGRKNRTDGEQACKAFNGTLPQPRGSTDVFNLLATLLTILPGSSLVPFYIDMFRTKNEGRV